VCAVATLSLFNVAPMSVASGAPAVASSAVIAVSTGYQTSLALLADKTVVAWGDNKFGQVGNGTANSAYVPLRVCAVGVESCPPGAPASAFLQGVSAIAAGAFFSVALVDGGVLTWGRSGEGSRGSLGTGTPRGNGCGGGCQTIPAQVCAVGVTSCPAGSPASSFLHGVKAIAAGTAFTLAILDDDTVVAWGTNALGQLGNPRIRTSSSTPVAVCAVKVRSCPPGSKPEAFLNNVSAVSAGDTFAMALKDHVAISWGNNSYGELGTGKITGPESCNKVACSHAPLVVTKMNLPVSAISAGNYHAMVIVDNPLGTHVGIMACGSNTNGQVGFDSAAATACHGNCQTTPIAVPGNWKGLTAISGGRAFSMALVGGKVMAWGSNHRPGRLGNGLVKNAHAPVGVCAVGVKLCPPGSPDSKYLQGVTAITAGGTVSLALLTNKVVIWGSNYKGALGIGSTAAGGTAFPIKVPALSG
jgi:alpha-tubulin suppressor-like RCC1 family protein